MRAERQIPTSAAAPPSPTSFTRSSPRHAILPG
jgi:hypothetical protein